MSRYYYDFHIHSCLSPCADNDNTPNNLAGMGMLSGLNIMALTDHNTSKNCPAFFAAAKQVGITPVAGMELTTAEDIHVICLFPKLCNAMDFDAEIDSRRVKIENRTDIFGDQLISDENDKITGTEKYLLPNATTVSLDEAAVLAVRYDGICYPAHIDRHSNGILAVLGTLPPEPFFSCVELNDYSRISEYAARPELKGKRFLSGSDAHRLEDIPDKRAFLELDGSDDDDELRKRLFEAIRRTPL